MKIFRLFILLSIVFINGCTNTQTQEPPRERTTTEKVALVAEIIIDNALYNGYDLGLGKGFAKTISNSTSNSSVSTSVDALGVINTHTTTKTTTKTKTTSGGFGIGY